MELLFRKYLWTVNLLFILLVALIVARTVNLFIESSLLSLPSSQVSEAPRTQPTWQFASLDVRRLSAITGLALPEPEPDVVEPSQPQVDPNDAPVRSSLRARLLGTLVASDSHWSIASVLDSVTQDSQSYMVGDRIQGAEVIGIERERIIVLNDMRKEFIDGKLGDGDVPAHAPSPVASAVLPPSNPNALGSSIRAIGENEYEVRRSELIDISANLAKVAMSARIVPAFKDGQAHGFKLFSIRPDSIYSKMGVQNGDVIKRINGFELNSPEKALELYARLKDPPSRVELEVERNGSTVRKIFNVR
ncbi:MAG TPA: type II secretion system protein GspC [Myxococcaceae bacterium]|nr:type II secretion system protein GspC [Myxococcaceae bacterium]